MHLCSLKALFTDLSCLQPVLIARSRPSFVTMLMAVFVRLAVRILIRGLFWGNAIGFGLALLQMQTGWIALDARSYYLSTVPIHLDVVRIAMVESGILLACALAMFIPARYISRLDPVESLRFD